MNINIAKGLSEVVRTSLGPNGSLKMMRNAAGRVKLSKDGNEILDEIELKHPVARSIHNAVTA